MAKYFTKEMQKRTLLMLIAVILMGVGVQFLNRTNLGPDPCSAMNFGFSALTGLSFGTYQLCFNAVLFLIIFFIDRKQFGLGTIGNMVVVGYSADFTGWVIITKFWWTIRNFTPKTCGMANHLHIRVLL